MDKIHNLIGGAIVILIVWVGMLSGLNTALDPVMNRVNPDIEALVRFSVFALKCLMLGFLVWVVIVGTFADSSTGKIGAYWKTVGKPFSVVLKAIGAAVVAMAKVVPTAANALLGGAKVAPWFAFWTALGVVTGLIAFAATGNLIGNSATSVAQFFADCFAAFVGLLHGRVPSYPNPATGLGILMQALVGIGMIVWVARSRPKVTLSLVTVCYLGVLLWPLAVQHAVENETKGERSTTWRVVRAIEGSRELGAAKVGQAADYLAGRADSEEYADVLTLKVDAIVYGDNRKPMTLADGTMVLPAGTKVRRSVGIEPPTPSREFPIRLIAVWREKTPGDIESFFLKFNDVEFPTPALGKLAFWNNPTTPSTTLPAPQPTATATGSKEPKSLEVIMDFQIPARGEKCIEQIPLGVDFQGDSPYEYRPLGATKGIELGGGKPYAGQMPAGPGCLKAGDRPLHFVAWKKATPA